MFITGHPMIGVAHQASVAGPLQRDGMNLPPSSPKSQFTHAHHSEAGAKRCQSAVSGP